MKKIIQYFYIVLVTLAVKFKIKKIARGVFAGLACIALPLAGSDYPGDFATQVYVCTGSLMVFGLCVYLTVVLSD
ncbi:MAG: hypothetical protein HOE02_05740 [Candidatus Marinimicrobia bacterium]|nr:hypothetical protein [Candidatus Neomarinimicrobiota bacterium]